MIDQQTAATLARAALTAHGLSGDLQPLRDKAPAAQAQLFTTDTLLVKVYSPKAAARATAQASRQMQVVQAMQGDSHRVPPVLFTHATTLIMPRIKGRNLRDLWRQANTKAPDMTDVPDVPVLAGHWLRRYHDLSLRRFPFRPLGHVNWLHRLVAQAEAGERALPDLPEFRASIARSTDLAEAARRQKSTRAVTHRDMTLSNLLYDGSTTWGIDFENTREDEPLRDLFTLALDLATVTDAPTLNTHALSSLRDAYGDQHSAPPVRLFLQRCFCAWVWANTPPQPSRRQQRRLRFARDLLDSDRLIL